MTAPLTANDVVLSLLRLGKVCRIPDCGRLVLARGLCGRHYQRRAAGKDPAVRAATELTASERFWSRVAVVGDCWEWQGSRDKNGYGIFSLEGRNCRAHRFAYEDMVGPIPSGLVLDHYVCDNPPCVNPYHVTPATNRHNVNRSVRTFPGRNIRKTHCPCGHAYETHGRRGSNGERYCRLCKTAASVRYASEPGQRERTLAARRTAYWANPDKFRTASRERQRRYTDARKAVS